MLERIHTHFYSNSCTYARTRVWLVEFFLFGSSMRPPKTIFMCLVEVIFSPTGLHLWQIHVLKWGTCNAVKRKLMGEAKWVGPVETAAAEQNTGDSHSLTCVLSAFKEHLRICVLMYKPMLYTYVHDHFVTTLGGAKKSMCLVFVSSASLVLFGLGPLQWLPSYISVGFQASMYWKKLSSSHKLAKASEKVEGWLTGFSSFFLFALSKDSSTRRHVGQIKPLTVGCLVFCCRWMDSSCSISEPSSQYS